jgi:hypothetical protein
MGWQRAAVAGLGWSSPHHVQRKKAEKSDTIFPIFPIPTGDPNREGPVARQKCVMDLAKIPLRSLTLLLTVSPTVS